MLVSRGSIDGLLRSFLCTVLYLGALAGSSFASDYSLRIEYHHQMKLMGVPAVQTGEWIVRLRDPNIVRIDFPRLSSHVVYRYEQERLLRFEIDHETNAVSSQIVNDVGRRTQDSQPSPRMDMPRPQVISAGMKDDLVWESVFSRAGLDFMHFIQSGRIVMATAIDPHMPAPPPELMQAVAHEFPFSKDPIALLAFSKLLEHGMPAYFEYAPRGPEYFHFNLLECREERLPFEENIFRTDAPPASTLRPPGAMTPPSDSCSQCFASRKEFTDGTKKNLGRSCSSGLCRRDTASSGTDGAAFIPRNEYRFNCWQEQGKLE